MANSLAGRPRRRAGLLSTVAVALSVGTLGCREKPAAVAALPAMGAMVPTTGNTPLDGEITAIQAQLRTGSGAPNPELWVRLGRSWIRKARQAGDPSLYQRAGDAAERALAQNPEQPGALDVRLAVLLNEHRFVEAQKLATARIKQSPRDALAWGTLGDSAMELGDYDSAIDAYQVMVDLKPDIRSYARGAWMRWLTGDGDGALELMHLALGAGSPKEPEAAAYCYVQLGDLHFARGQYAEARQAYDLALRHQPGYPTAHAGRGRLLLALSGPAACGEAVSDLAAAVKAQPTAAHLSSYASTLAACGRKEEAERAQAELLRDGPREDPRTTALYLASHGIELQQALRLAQEELAKRPDIFSYDAVAWAAYRLGQLDLAASAIEKATRWKTQEPRLLYHLGVIAAARGDKQRAVSALRAALEKSPHWDPREPDEARALLEKLDAAPPTPAPTPAPGK